MTPGEFAIMAAAEKLSQLGRSFPGVFREGDFGPVTGRSGGAQCRLTRSPSSKSLPC